MSKNNMYHEEIKPEKAKPSGNVYVSCMSVASSNTQSIFPQKI